METTGRWIESKGKSKLMQGMKVIAIVTPGVNGTYNVEDPRRFTPVASNFPLNEAKKIAESLLP